MKKKQINWFLVTGYTLISIGIYIATSIYFPIAKNEIGYQVSRLQENEKKELVPVDKSFGILIPKIQANSKVIKNVDPFNSNIYQKALSQGVAHAKTSALPGSKGNVFLFSHSSADFLTASRYNSIFYLLNKLVIGDEIKIFYEDKEYIYHVTSKRVVEPTDTSFIYSKASKETLSLMTCWPPGTSLKRLVVQATLLP